MTISIGSGAGEDCAVWRVPFRNQCPGCGNHVCLEGFKDMCGRRNLTLPAGLLWDKKSLIMEAVPLGVDKVIELRHCKRVPLIS